ncbi:threonine efflux system [compost metagenome]
MLVNLFWASGAILGIDLIFALFPWLAMAVKIAGAGYLIWFGCRLFAKAKPASGLINPDARAKSGSRVAFLQGIATNISRGVPTGKSV